MEFSMILFTENLNNFLKLTLEQVHTWANGTSHTSTYYVWLEL
jgi:hypothetical protein